MKPPDAILGANLVPAPGAVFSEAEEIARLKDSLMKRIRRSAYVFRVDCGGCNGCEIEIFAAFSPIFDAERFGIKLVSSPRHADILLYTGSMTRSMRLPAIRSYRRRSPSETGFRRRRTNGRAGSAGCCRRSTKSRLST